MNFFLASPLQNLKSYIGKFSWKNLLFKSFVPHKESIDCFSLELLEVLEIRLTFVAKIVLKDIGQEIALVFGERDVQRIDFVQFLGNGCDILSV